MTVQVTSAVHELAESLQENFDIPANGQSTATKDWYAKTLPEGLTVDLYEKFAAHHTNLAAAALLANGNKSIPAMVANPDLTRTSLEIPLPSKDSITATMDRSKEYPIPSQDGVAGTKTVYGRSTVSFDMYGAGKRGQVSAVRTMLTERAEKELGC